MLVYLLVRFFSFFLGLLPYRALHSLGRLLGSIVYYCYPPFRKKALANLSIAFGQSRPEKELKLLARRSFQNLMITLLEFPKLMRGDIEKMVTMVEPEKMTKLQQQGQGIVFLTAHQANWELPFIVANLLSPGGVAIGRHINNSHLYRWVLSIRESKGGKIVTPKRALKEGLKALKRGKYIGIVGDQAHPDSPYSYPLFGTRAWITNAPALLAYKSNCPVMVVTNRRLKGKYELRGSAPLYPNYDLPLKESVKELMDRALSHLEQSLKEAPDQWMWIHDQWKQQGIDHVKRKYRHGFILVLLPKNPDPLILPRLEQVYPRSFLTIKDDNFYQRDYRYQLVLDFANLPKVRKFYKKLGAKEALYLTPQTLKEVLVKPECQHIVSI